MSDHYLISMRFDIRKDAPASLHAALTLLAEGRIPDEASIKDLPGLVQEYLLNAGVPGDGVQLYMSHGPKMKYRDGALVEVEYEPHEGTHSLRMTRTFHDDEYFNGGMYFPYWLYQFSATDGPIATRHQINGNAIPQIITKNGDVLIETSLEYHPAPFWPIHGQPQPDATDPVKIKENRIFNLPDFLNDLAIFKDGFAYD